MLFGGFHRAQPPNPWMHFQFHGHKILVEPTSKHCVRRHVVNKGSFVYMIHIPVSFCCRGPGGVSAVLLRCAGAVNGDDTSFPSLRQRSVASPFAGKHVWQKTAPFWDVPVFLDALWVPPGCPLWPPRHLPLHPKPLGWGVAGAAFGNFACNNKPS